MDKIAEAWLLCSMRCDKSDDVEHMDDVVGGQPGLGMLYWFHTGDLRRISTATRVAKSIEAHILGATRYMFVTVAGRIRSAMK